MIVICFHVIKFNIFFTFSDFGFMVGKSISYFQYENFTYTANITMENYRICEDAQKWVSFFLCGWRDALIQFYWRAV